MPKDAETPDVGLTTVTARAVLPPLEDAAGRADLVAERLHDAIRLGLVLDGERLPAESVLAEQLRVSTVTLRDALATLREQGLLITRRGRHGGSFVRAPADHLAAGLAARLLQWSIQDLRELGDHRAAISGAAASLAARRALPSELGRLHSQLERLGAAETPSERRRADTQFTIEVASAAQSSRLTREELRLRAEVGDLLWVSHDDADHTEAVRLRRRLVGAVESRHAGSARSLAERLVTTDTQRLVQMRLDVYDLQQGTGRSDLGAVAR